MTGAHHGSAPGPAGAAAGETTDPAWRRLALVFAVVSFIETVGFGHYLVFLPILVRELDVPPETIPTAVGLLSSAALLAGLPLVPFWGVWAERYSRKLIVVRSAAVEAVLFLVLAFVGELWQLFLVVPLVGLVLGNSGVMLSELTDRTPRSRLGFAIGLVGTAGPLGLAVGPAFGGAVADAVGLSALFLLDAALTLAATVLLVVAYHERHDRPRPSERVLVLVQRSLLAAVRTPVARAFFATYLLLLLGQRFLLPYLALYIEQLHGPRDLALLAGLVAAGYGLAAAVGSPLISGLADRVGHPRVLLGSLLGTVGAMVAAAFAPGLIPFGVIYALFGVGVAASSAVLFTLLARGLEPGVRAPVLNLALVPLYVSGVVGGVASAGVIAASAGDLRQVWLVSAAIAALAILPARGFRTDRRASAPSAATAGGS